MLASRMWNAFLSPGKMRHDDSGKRGLALTACASWIPGPDRSLEGKCGAHQRAGFECTEISEANHLVSYCWETPTKFGPVLSVQQTLAVLDRQKGNCIRRILG